MFTPNDGYVVPPPGENDAYEIVDGKAVWKLYTTDEPCPPVVVPSNGQYEVVGSCFLREDDMIFVVPNATITFTNPVDLEEGEEAEAAEFTYTDADGETQTVTVPANEEVVVTIVFSEDSGDQMVTVGLKGEEQETVTVQTDCRPPLVPVIPPNPVITDKCGTADDGWWVPGTLEWSISGTYENGDTYAWYDYLADGFWYFVNDDVIDGKRSVLIWARPIDENAYIPEPTGDSTYVLDFGSAVWEYSFTNEACPTPTPTPTPTPPVTPPATPPSSLASTGAGSESLIALVAILMGLGTIAVRVGSRLRKGGLGA